MKGPAVARRNMILIVMIKKLSRAIGCKNGAKVVSH